MLKSDAIPIVDVLEGYPDIFVSACLGDINGSGPLGIAGDNVSVSSHNGREPIVRQTSTSRVNSMGRFNSSYGESEYGDDAYDACLVILESINEGLIMSIVFALFSVVPAIVHIYTPRIVKHLYDTEGNFQKQGIHPITITIIVLNIIMIFLGFWKR